MTRARAELYLLRAERRLRFGTISERPPSRFLEEIPREHVKILSAPERPARRGLSGPTGPTMDYSYSQLSDHSESVAVAGGGLPPGTKVRHPTFGIGIVRRSEGRGEQEKLMVQFARAGMKKLIRRFANLEIVGDFDEPNAQETPVRYYSR
jgi:DNA helicase-2/ATP-dependent DNA helicase PcrA